MSEDTAYNHGLIKGVDLQREMEKSCLDYAMSVIVGRALPDVRGGLKPVHRRVIYAMYNGSYRPDNSFSKPAKVVGDVMSHYHSHGDVAIYDTVVRLVQPWSVRYPLVTDQDNFGTPGDLGAAASRYTEVRMAPLAMEMVREIKEQMVDFEPNYDGSLLEPTVLTSRFPNLLVNGSEGIAVGMATRIPPHNLRKVTAGAQWHLENPDATKEELLAALIQRVKGPDFPTDALILGTRGIEDTYRTGHGLVTQRAVVEVDEIHGRQCLVVTDLSCQINLDRLLDKMVEGIKDGRFPGIADIRDEASGRTGQRIVVVLRKDAVARVVLNNLYKHTQLQNNFPANMLALVDGVPRTLSLGGFVRHWVIFQMEVILRRTEYRLSEAPKRLHTLGGYLKALDQLDAVIALIRSLQTVDLARTDLMDLLEIDEDQANATLEMQLRRLAALERQKIIDKYEEKTALVAGYKDIIAKPEHQRAIIGEKLGAIVDKYRDDRRTTTLPSDGGMSVEDLIPEEDVVVTVTRGGFIKRAGTSEYRAQHRDGKGIKGASLRRDNIVEHSDVGSTYEWRLFFTNLNRVHRIKGYEVPEAGRDAEGQHIANLLAFQPGETIASTIALKSCDQAQYLMLATADGLVKKTRLSDYDSPRIGGLIAIKFRKNGNGTDHVVAACLVDEDDDLLLVSRKGMSLRFKATDEALRPMGRPSSGVTGMKFREGDSLPTMRVVRDNTEVFVVTEGGFAKRTSVDEYRTQGHADLGIKVTKLTEEQGDLIGALITEGEDVMVIMESGKMIRASTAGVSKVGCNTQGVTFARPDGGNRITAIARNVETTIEAEVGQSDGEGENAVDTITSVVEVSTETAADYVNQVGATE